MFNNLYINKILLFNNFYHTQEKYFCDNHKSEIKQISLKVPENVELQIEENFPKFPLTSQEDSQDEIPVESTEVAVIESAGTYEVIKNIFGKEKVKRVK